MRILVIDNDVRAAIKRVIEHAEHNPFSRGAIEDIIAGKAKPPGNQPGFVVHIRQGYRVVYTIETHAPGKTVRHISISVPVTDKYPNPAAALSIMKEFGFKHGPEPPNKVSDHEKGAINIYELIEK